MYELQSRCGLFTLQPPVRQGWAGRLSIEVPFHMSGSPLPQPVSDELLDAPAGVKLPPAGPVMCHPVACNELVCQLPVCCA